MHVPEQETQEPWVWSAGQGHTLGEKMATHSNILAWKIPWTEELGRATVHGVAKSRTRPNTHRVPQSQQDWGYAASLLTPFNFTSFKALSPNTFTSGVRPSTYIFWVGKQGGIRKDPIWFEQRVHRIWDCGEGWGWKEGLVWTLFTLGNLENFTDFFSFPLSQILISEKELRTKSRRMSRT